MFEVTFTDGTVEKFSNLLDVQEGILAAHANGLLVDEVYGVDAEGNVLQVYGCTWSVSIDPLD